MLFELYKQNSIIYQNGLNIGNVAIQIIFYFFKIINRNLLFYDIFQGIAFQGLKGLFYPFVGFRGSIKVNFGRKKFKYAGKLEQCVFFNGSFTLF